MPWFAHLLNDTEFRVTQIPSIPPWICSNLSILFSLVCGSGYTAFKLHAIGLKGREGWRGGLEGSVLPWPPSRTNSLVLQLPVNQNQVRTQKFWIGTCYSCVTELTSQISLLKDTILDLVINSYRFTGHSHSHPKQCIYQMNYAW